MLDDARAAGDPSAVATALRAQGLAHRELGDLAVARARLEEAAAVEGASPRSAALARGSLASVLAAAGSLGDALDQVEAAAAMLDGDATADHALLAMQRADVLLRLGRQDAAMAAFERAIAAASAAGDARTEALARGNRGILLTYVGRFDEATADLELAEALFRRLDMHLFAADCRHNRGFVAARRGDVVGALARLDEARAEHESLGVERPAAWLDECEVLLGALLSPEARELAANAESRLVAQQQLADAAEAALLLARASEADGDLEAASAAARRAADAFAQQGRAAWQGLAELVELRVAGRPASAPAALALADRFAALGWVSEEVEAALLAGRLSPSTSGALARASAAGRAHPLARVRVLGWWAEALARRAAGDVGEAMAAARRGVRAATDAAAVLPARELRSAATGHGAGVAGLGLELAWSTGRPAAVLSWAEALRATTLALPPIRPPADAELEADLAALRASTRDAEDAALAGTMEVADALAEQARLERRVLRRSRRLGGPGSGSGPRSTAGAGPLAPLGIADLGHRLGGRTFVELVDVGGTLGAVVVGDGGAGRGRARLVRLGETASAASEVAALRFALGRVLTPGSRRSSIDASVASADAAAQRLDELVLGPIRARVSGEGAVIIPTGPLHGVPWAVLPSLRGVPVSVAPSARSWLATTGGERPGGGTVALVGGPGIPELDAELAAIAEAHGPSARVVVRAEATAAEAFELLGEADVVHLAAHGRFRGDSPMFSSLTFADGPLTVHDLAGLRSAPSLVVLSACEVGRSEVRPGDEVQGVVSVLLGLGTRTLVASVLPVPHELACDVTVGFHRGLVRGLGPAAALAAAVPEGSRSPFIVFGGG